MTTLFVYGTLKRGYGNNERCLGGAKFLGEAISVEANYVMQRIGFPILWQTDDVIPGAKVVGAKVSGELFEISEEHLAACDRLEGHPRAYRREEREFVLYEKTDPVTVIAWVYLWQGKTTGNPISPVNGVLTWVSYGEDGR